MLSEMLDDVPHYTVFGEKEVDERLRAKVKFDNGKRKLIITNQVFKKGISINTIECIIDAAAFKSKNDAVQKYGRGVRLADGKTGLLYFDINDRGPEGTVKGDDEFNRFSHGSKSRLKAFKAKGIPIFRVSSGLDAEAIFDKAEEKLDKYLRRLKKAKIG
jgi:superfamily II DNA or RNA helicase